MLSFFSFVVAKIFLAKLGFFFSHQSWQQLATSTGNTRCTWLVWWWKGQPANVVESGAGRLSCADHHNKLFVKKSRSRRSNFIWNSVQNSLSKKKKRKNKFKENNNQKTCFIWPYYLIRLLLFLDRFYSVEYFGDSGRQTSHQV